MCVSIEVQLHEPIITSKNFYVTKSSTIKKKRLGFLSPSPDINRGLLIADAVRIIRKGYASVPIAIARAERAKSHIAAPLSSPLSGKSSSPIS